MTAWLRGVLAIALLWGIYVLAVVLVAVDAGFVILEFGVVPSNVSFGFVVGIVIASVPTAAAIIVALFTVSQETGPRPDSAGLTAGQAPALWAMVTELADAVGTRPPAELRVVATANAQVSEECRFLGLVVGTRRLYVGLPLLLGLSVDELRAVLCHELGHYARSHTRTGPVVYRGADILREILAWFLRPGPKRRRRMAAPMFEWAFSRYAIFYFRLSAAVLRQQEAEADTAAVAAADRAALGDALRATYATGMAWDQYLSQYAGTVLRQGFVPEGLFDGFAEMLSDPLYQDALAAARRSPPDRPPARFDSHPSIAARLRQIGEDDGDAGDRDLTPAISLLAEPRRVLEKVQAITLPRVTDPSRRLPWPEWAGLVAQVRTAEAARELLGAARRVAVEPAPSLSTVLDLLHSGKAARLAVALDPAGAVDGNPAEAGLRRLRRGLAALAGCLLVQSGYADWRLSWTEAGLLTGLDLAVVEYRDLVNAAVESPGQVDHLRAHLVYLGIDLSTPLAPAGLPGRPGTAAELSWPAQEAATPQHESITAMTIALFVVLALAGVVAAAVKAAHTHSATPPVAFSGQLGGVPSALEPPVTEPSPLLPSSLFSPGVVPSFKLPGIGQLTTFRYTVRSGDSLSAIACRFLTTVSALQQANHLGRRTVIHPGQILLIHGLPVAGLIDSACG